MSRDEQHAGQAENGILWACAHGYMCLRVHHFNLGGLRGNKCSVSKLSKHSSGLQIDRY